MKTLISLIVCAPLALTLTGCVTADRDNGHERASDGDSHRTHHQWYCDDGYTFSYDPYNRDMLAPTLGLDPMFPPPYIPCQY